MKYNVSNTVIPQDKRKDINQKVLHIIENGLDCGISAEDIYNAYTGDGGLHGLEMKDYDSFYAFSEAKKEVENGQFFTSPALAVFVVGCLRPAGHDLVADLTMGHGAFCNWLPNEVNFYGTELDIKAYKVAKYLYPEANLSAEDIRFYDPGVKFDMVLGNPPFNLRWKVGKDEYLSQLYYCIKAADLLKPAGLLAMIAPESFLQDDFSDGGMIDTINGLFNYVCQFSLPANAFKGMGVELFDTKLMIFQRKSEHLEPACYSTTKISAPPLNDAGAEIIYNSYIKALVEKKESIKAKLFLENLRKEDGGHTREFEDTVRKWLFAIKSHPVINKHYAKALEYVERYYAQKKPADMSWEDFEKTRITKPKVLAYLKRVLKRQHEKELDKIALVKTQYGLKLKAYSRKSKAQLNKMVGIKEISLNDTVLCNEYPFADKSYAGVVRRRRRDYEKQSRPMKDLPVDIEIARFLASFSLKDKYSGQVIRFSEIQREDLGKVLQKDYALLAWQMGGGKSLCGIAWYSYMLKKKRLQNIFVASAAISINLTWEGMLTRFDQDFIKVRSLKDIEAIRPGQVVLISFDMLVKYQRQIKKFVRLRSQKIGLIVDESDELTNSRSQRSKATLNCFRRVKAKLLTTGTSTRNNINELYSQLELLYNNSINMLCECDYIYRYNKENDLVELDNAYSMKPFPAYHGRALFKGCFNPHKVTVFGVRRHNQDLYNADALGRIIEKTVITRKLKEIVGRDLYAVKTHRIKQNAAEREVYRVIIEEFYNMLYLFRSTGNARKDSMLAIIRQIQLLIKSTSIPNVFREYRSTELPNKFKYMFELLEKFRHEKVALGTVFIESAELYYQEIKARFPDRPVFLIKGSVGFNRRKSIITEFEATANGILISTQQSLKSSVNIPTCDKVILADLQWNMAKIEQYYFRFIRFDSRNQKEVHVLTYEHSIEQNLLALLMAKERINEYVRTLDLRDEADIFGEYGIDLDILDSLIERVRDEDGKLRLSWGNQVMR